MFLVLGSTGYVGKYFLKYISSLGEDVRGLSRVDFDYTDESKLTLLKEVKPKFLINAAGYTGKPNVDACEYDKAECLLGIQYYPEEFEQHAKKFGIPWGHVSSGCIYSGKNLAVKDGMRKMSQIFLFRNGPCSLQWFQGIRRRSS